MGRNYQLNIDKSLNNTDGEEGDVDMAPQNERKQYIYTLDFTIMSSMILTTTTTKRQCMGIL